MTYKWIGAVFVITSCGGFGFSLAAAHRRELLLLRQLSRVLAYMESELKYRLTPLPELCRLTAREAGAGLRTVFLDLAKELEQFHTADAAQCMTDVVRRSRDQLPGSVRKLLLRLGRSLGRFDLEGQLRGLQALAAACGEEIALLNQNRDMRLRNYQTLSLCAGVALAILFL